MANPSTMSSQPVKLIFGGASLGPAIESEFPTVEATKGALELLKARGVTTIDTARMYPDSEDYPG
jgi:aflatoxin B1 aldehyde reductase